MPRQRAQSWTPAAAADRERKFVSVPPGARHPVSGLDTRPYQEDGTLRCGVRFAITYDVATDGDLAWPCIQATTMIVSP